MDPFLIKALIAGIAVAIITSILGCFVVWKRMAYFSDSLSHSALLGVAIGTLLGIHLNLSIIVISCAFAALLSLLQNQKHLHNDTLLGVLAHIALAFSVVILSLMDNVNFDLHSYLFGNILLASEVDIYWALLSVVTVIGCITFYWHALLLTVVNEEIAKSEKVNTQFIKILILFLMAFSVTVCVRVVGVLLTTAMLIIPVATVQQYAHSPITTILYSMVISVCAVVIGILSSLLFNTPTGPSIVLVNAAFFTISSLLYMMRSR